ncbi:MAG: hypothetical protein C4290_14525 [Chloroflexota bacterium]
MTTGRSPLPPPFRTLDLRATPRCTVPSMEGYLTIGRLAAEAGLSTDTIRYYEAIGLLPAPARSATGYRLYPRAEVRRLRLIKRAKLLGLPLGEIRNLVEQTYTGSCAHLRQELMHRIPN